MKLNWKAADMRWRDGEMYEVAEVLMNKTDDELSFKEIEVLYEKGFYLEVKEGTYYVPFDLEDVKFYINELQESLLYQVYTLQEAAAIWGEKEVTVRQWCNRGKFTDKEARKSAGTWLISHEGMERVAGELE